MTDMQKYQIRKIHSNNPEYTAKEIGSLVGLSADTIARFRKNEGLHITRVCKCCGASFEMIHKHQNHCIKCNPKMKTKPTFTPIDRDAITEKYSKILENVWKEIL